MDDNKTRDIRFDELCDRLLHDPPLVVRSAESWTIVPAFFGSGTVLVGPAGDGHRTAAIAPPGVWARNPDGHAHRISRNGWRLILWAPHRLIDEHRPVSVETLKLAELALFLSPNPYGWLWAERVVTAQLRLLWSLSEQDRARCVSDDQETSRYEALRAEASDAFGHELMGTTPGIRLEDLAQAWPQSDATQTAVTGRPSAERFVVVLKKTDRSALATAGKIVRRFNTVSDAERFVTEAQIQSRKLSAHLLRRLIQFRRFGNRAGALLLRGVPIGRIPPTPPEANQSVGAHLFAAAVMAVIAGVLGEQYGFSPELGGRMVQDILPVRGSEDSQQSISSRAELFAHVDKAFSENRPDFVFLMCLRPDHARVARTTLSSWNRIFPLLEPRIVEVLSQPRFETYVDESFLRGAGLRRPIAKGPIRVLNGGRGRPSVRADFAETRGLDPEAQAALDHVADLADKLSVKATLDAGDMLIIDNRTTFHGRTSFTARWDGRDRWLLRTFVMIDLARSADGRPGDGRIVGGCDDEGHDFPDLTLV